MLFKIVLLHLDGIPSLRGTLRRAQTDIVYRWFLGYTLNEALPHFSTVSYSFRHRYTEETIEGVFRRILDEAGMAGALPPGGGIHRWNAHQSQRKSEQENQAGGSRGGEAVPGGAAGGDQCESGGPREEAFR
ncbi:MAG: transposase [Clostridiales bacterium]|nr:transposase [Clostridiales bacterium]